MFVWVRVHAHCRPIAGGGPHTGLVPEPVEHQVFAPTQFFSLRSQICPLFGGAMHLLVPPLGIRTVSG